MLGVFTPCGPAQVSQPLGVYLQTQGFVPPWGSRRHIDSLSSFTFPSVIPELVATAGGQGSHETLDFPRELPPVVGLRSHTICLRAAAGGGSGLFLKFLVNHGDRQRCRSVRGPLVSAAAESRF